jgi:hypothetical protein
MAKKRAEQRNQTREFFKLCPQVLPLESPAPGYMVLGAKKDSVPRAAAKAQLQNKVKSFDFI